MMRLKNTMLAGLTALGLLGFACDGGADLETRTFELEYLDEHAAEGIIQPYVYRDRPNDPGTYSLFPGGITVRETHDNLEKIARVLEDFDRPRPGVRLTFQIIEADGRAVADPQIADIEAALRKLFRFDGYRLVAEAQVGALSGGESRQVIREANRTYEIRAFVREIRQARRGGSVDLQVELVASGVGSVIQTSMAVPVGQTVVLGSARPEAGRAALILTVRPEFVTDLEEGAARTEPAAPDTAR